MNLIKVITILIFLTCFSCKENMSDDSLKKIAKVYISEVSIEEGDYIFIKEQTHDGLKIYRVYASKNVDIENPPFEYYELENHFVFLFDDHNEKVPIEELIRKFEINNEGLYYDPEEWVFFSCQGSYRRIKDASYAPIDSLEKRIGEIECI